jgi:hypothetical protein
VIYSQSKRFNGKLHCTTYETAYTDDTDGSELAERPRLSAYASCQTPQDGLGPMIDDSIQELKNIRIMHAKITALKQNATVCHTCIYTLSQLYTH